MVCLAVAAILDQDHSRSRSVVDVSPALTFREFCYFANRHCPQRFVVKVLNDELKVKAKGSLSVTTTPNF